MDEPMTVRWQVTFLWGHLDAIGWLSLLAGTAYVVACVWIGWALGAALGAFALGAELTLIGFLNGHLVMDEPRIWTPAGRSRVLRRRSTPDRAGRPTQETASGSHDGVT